ncbi:MAG: hypothetical protein VCD33_14020 [Alphaproteobacteria bacterium]
MGTITAGEYHSYYRIIVASPWFRAGLKRIHDCRGAVMTFTPTEVLSQASTYDTMAAAFGEDRGALIFGGAEGTKLMRAFLDASTKVQGFVEIFDNYADARTWVGLPEDCPDPFVDAW